MTTTHDHDDDDDEDDDDDNGTWRRQGCESFLRRGEGRGARKGESDG